MPKHAWPTILTDLPGCCHSSTALPPQRAPAYRSWQRPYDEKFVADTAQTALDDGVAERGVAVFASAQNACMSCHKIGRHGGTVGPDLTNIGHDRTAEQIVESLHWPNRTVSKEYAAISVLTVDGRLREGYPIPLERSARPAPRAGHRNDDRDSTRRNRRRTAARFADARRRDGGDVTGLSNSIWFASWPDWDVTIR